MWKISCHSILIFFVAFTFQSKGQPSDSVYTLIYTLPEKAKYFTTDQLRQIYIVTNENEIVKYSADHKELFRFNNNTLGSLGYIDATDPFHLLCFYPEFLTVIILDRTLSQAGEYNLYDLDIIDVKTVGLSNDNNIWIYDDLDFKLKKINRKGEVLVESDDLNLRLGISIQPIRIKEKNNIVFVNAPEEGFLLFDNFGSYIKTIPIKTDADFQIIEEQLIYRETQHLFVFHLKSLLTKKIALPKQVTQEDRVRIQKDRMYVQRGAEVKVYQF